MQVEHKRVRRIARRACEHATCLDLNELATPIRLLIFIEFVVGHGRVGGMALLLLLRDGFALLLISSLGFGLIDLVDGILPLEQRAPFGVRDRALRVGRMRRRG